MNTQGAQMIPILFFASFIIYIYFGIYVLILDSKSVLNRVFFIACIFLGLWAFTYTFMVSAPDVDTALMWRRFSVLGWCSVYGILLHFFLVLTGKDSILKKWWSYPLLYLPPALLIYGYLVAPGMTVNNLVMTQFGWTYLSPYSEGINHSHLFDIYYSIYMGTGVVLTWKWGKKSLHTREKKQAKLIITTIVIALLLGSITDTIMPNLGVAHFPQIAIIIILIPIFGIWYSIKKYRLMYLTPENAAKDILKTMKDGLLLVGIDGKIRLANDEALALLGYDAGELIDKPVQVIFPEGREAFQPVFKELNNDRAVQHVEEILLTKTKKRIPTLFSTSFIHDDWGEAMGLVCTFQDIAVQKQTEEELLKAKDQLEKRVDERTRELLIINESLKAEIKERERIQEKVKFYAYHDHLTGLPNKLLLRERLDQAILQAARTEKILAVLFLDIDTLKTVNDTMGYSMGDELLKSVAERLLRALRKSDTVARIGGDEFVVMIQNLSDVNAVTKVADKIISQFNEPFCLNGQNCYCTASVGIALYPTDGEDMEMLIKNADIAMYRAKETGRNRYKFCSSSMKSKAMETVRLTNNLYRALDNNELVVYYQPQINSSSGKIIGVETLLRWKHPELGLILPELFIPIAEKTGLIMPIGKWVLRTVCKQCKKWQNAGLPGIRMAVNLSMHQVQNPGIVECITSIIAETGLDPKYLELEITESAAMKETRNIVKTLHSFKALGVTISIDDFGTEFSSLNYLKQLPVDRIKIAMPFVQGICESSKDEAIVKGIITLASNLDMKVIAEGVETGQQLAFLSQHRCEEVQGYYYYKPMTANEFEEVMRKKQSNSCAGA
jgi:diguanylate cyclase (GGDEF)-like protein/PAS domain S-box-containing protein